MTLDLHEGKTFPNDYILDRRLGTSARAESWVATHKHTGDRVFVRCITGAVSHDDWLAAGERLGSIRGLVHENILLLSAIGIEDDTPYLILPYLPGARKLDIGNGDGWMLVKQAITALRFTHNLGIAHGNLHPGNILVSTDTLVQVCGFGLPPALDTDPDHSQWRSAQVESGATPERSDDIYSLGCLIFELVTGRSWAAESGTIAELELDTPLPLELRSLLAQMLSESSLDRDLDLATVSEVLTRYYEDDRQAIESVDFRRGQKEPGPETSGVPANATRNARAVPMQMVLLAMGALVIIALLLFTLLPTDPVAPAQTTTAQAPAAASTSGQSAAQPQVPPALTPLEAARLAQMEKEGEEIASEILRVQIELEDQGVILWASETYEQLTADLDAADALYRESRYFEALEAYRAVMDRLQELENEIPGVLANWIERGNAALLEGDARTAIEAFTIAVAIQPGDGTMAQKLERAENLDEVKLLVSQAEVMERNGEVEAALNLFQDAASLDKAWPPATEGLRRIKAEITRRDFQLAMSRGFQGIASRDYVAARAGFREAERIMPGSPEPEDGLRQVAQAETNDRIVTIRTRAESLIAGEDWSGAIDAYNEALEIADSLTFAQEGLAYARERLALSEQIDSFLNDPTLLQSDEELATASAALREAARLPEKSPALKQRIDTLARLISTARIPVAVRITSDGKTDVTVRRHAELGKITSEVVNLVPGRYAIVGQRSGFRDVREDLVLIAGRPVPAIHIASTEPVR